MLGLFEYSMFKMDLCIYKRINMDRFLRGDKANELEITISDLNGIG